MSRHPDVLIGSAAADGGASIQVLVSGVDVRLTVRRPGHEDAVIFLAPDDAIDLRDLLSRTLEV
jgi:hypothetical protein